MANLVCEPSAKTKEDAAEDEHIDVHCRTADGGSGEEEGATGAHGEEAAESRGGVGSYEGCEESGNIE